MTALIRGSLVLTAMLWAYAMLDALAAVRACTGLCAAARGGW